MRELGHEAIAICANEKFTAQLSGREARKMTYSIWRLAPVFAAIVFYPNLACSYNFTPTDSEWHAWPDYCKAKYVWNIVGQSSKFYYQVDDRHRQQLKPWEDAGIRGVHHYCTGTIWLQRALMAKDTQEKSYMLRNALDETMFTFNGSSDSSAPQFAYVTIQLARIFYEQGELEHAIQVLQGII